MSIKLEIMNEKGGKDKAVLSIQIPLSEINSFNFHRKSWDENFEFSMEFDGGSFCKIIDALEEIEIFKMNNIFQKEE